MMPLKQVDLYWYFKGTHYYMFLHWWRKEQCVWKVPAVLPEYAASNFRSSNHTTVHHVRGIVIERLDREFYLLMDNIFRYISYLQDKPYLPSFQFSWYEAQNFFSGWATGPGTLTEMWNWFDLLNIEQVQAAVKWVLILGVFIRSGVFWSSWATIRISRKKFSNFNYYETQTLWPFWFLFNINKGKGKAVPL
jgi:hypothetical protein